MCLLLMLYAVPLFDFSGIQINYQYPEGNIQFKQLNLSDSGLPDLERFVNNAFIKIDVGVEENTLYFLSNNQKIEINDELIGLFNKNTFKVKNLTLKNATDTEFLAEDIYFEDLSTILNIKNLKLKCLKTGSDYLSLLNGCLNRGELSFVEFSKETIPTKDLKLVEFFLETIVSLSPLPKKDNDILEIKQMKITSSKKNFTITSKIASGFFNINVTIRGTVSFNEDLLTFKVVKASAGMFGATSLLFEKLEPINELEDSPIKVASPYIYLDIKKLLKSSTSD